MARLLDCASICLSAERARVVKPDGEVTDDNTPAVAEIGCWLEGPALAISQW